MTLTPQERAEVLRMVAERIVEELRAEAGGLAKLVLIPVPTVARMLGITVAATEKQFRVVQLSHRSRGISLDQLQALTRGTPDLQPAAAG